MALEACVRASHEARAGTASEEKRGLIMIDPSLKMDAWESRKRRCEGSPYSRNRADRLNVDKCGGIYF